MSWYPGKGGFTGFGEVQDSHDLRRVLNIPRRVYPEANVEALRMALTDALKTRQGTWTLRPVQALALNEIGRYRGLLAPIRVGGGKTLLSLLAPRMVPDVERPLILLPAHLRDKTQEEKKELRFHWVLPPFCPVRSYQELGRETGADYLDEYRPDMIICDEGHYLKNRGAAVTKRVGRYLRDNRGTIFVIMTGTLTKRSIHDWAHLGAWALGTSSPAPLDPKATDEWGRAMDVNVAEHRVLAPGALRALCDGPEETVRSAFQRRLVQTPGVIATQEGPLPISLTIKSHLLHSPPDMEEHWKTLRQEYETPDGWECADSKEVWRHAKEYAVGCYYRWNPRPPQEWVDARSEWASRARSLIAHNRSGYDTELQIRKAVRDGYSDDLDRKILSRWEAVRDEYDPIKNTEVVWISDHAVAWIKAWARKNTGIIWVHHKGLGLRLAREGLPYYANGGLEVTTGVAIEKARLGDGSIVASIASNGTGRNLQKWRNNLILGVPSNGSIWEQLLGRTHRDGQKADNVNVEVVFGCREDVEGFWRAVDDAEYAEEITGQAQKLVHADTRDVFHVDDLGTHASSWQWRPRAS